MSLLWSISVAVFVFTGGFSVKADISEIEWKNVLELRILPLELWQLWNFSMVQVKINRFLHLNGPPKRIFDNLYHLLIEDSTKLDISSFQCQFWKSKINSIYLKMIFLSEYSIKRTTFMNKILNLNDSQRNTFDKIVPYFWRLGIK